MVVVNSEYVPMIGCFVAGFVVSRLMNHQDVVTGEVKEGVMTSGQKIILIIVLCVVGLIVVCVVGYWHVKGPLKRRPAQSAAATRPFDWIYWLS